MAHGEMSDLTRIQYQRSEVTVPPIVYEAAAKFFAAYVVNDKVTNENEPAMLEKAVVQALDLALAMEKVVASSNNEVAA